MSINAAMKVMVNDPQLVNDGVLCDVCLMMFDQDNPTQKIMHPDLLMGKETTNLTMVKMDNRGRVAEVNGNSECDANGEPVTFDTAFPNLNIHYVRLTEDFRCFRIWPTATAKDGKAVAIGYDKSQPPVYIMQRIYKVVYSEKK